MRVWLLASVLAAGMLAGCAADGRDVGLVAFTATYAHADGATVTVTLDGPRPFLDRDGQTRLAYALETGAGDPFWGVQTEALDSGMMAWRSSGCWARTEGDDVCGHLQARWSNGSRPAYGVGGLLWGEAVSAGEGRLRVLAEGEPDGTEFYFYEYKPGTLWPERYVRTVPSFEHEEVVWQLVDVEVRGPLMGASPRLVPSRPTMPATQLFPGADQLFLPFPFTIAGGLEGLRSASSEAEALLTEGCVIDVQHRTPWRASTGPLPVNPIPAALGNEVVGSMGFGLMDAAGATSWWQVDLRRDVLGEETFTATRQEYPYMGPGLRCADRLGAQVGPDEVLAHLPRDLLQGDSIGFLATWNECCYGVSEGHLSYAISWFEDDQPHWRSVEVDASTGLYERFTYRPGDRIDPA